MNISPIAVVPTLSYDECIELCERLGLVETMQHGDKYYIRYTEDGVNALAGLIGLQSNIDSDEVLSPS